MFKIKRQTDRGKAMIYINNCMGCGECIKVYRRNAIGFYEPADGEYAKLINPGNCTGCGKCLRVCENNAIEIIKPASWKN